MQVGESAILELLEYANRPAYNDTPIQQNYLGDMHLAFHVEDIDAKVAELLFKGVHFLSDPNTVDEGVLAGWKWVYFHEPRRDSPRTRRGSLLPRGGTQTRHCRVPRPPTLARIKAPVTTSFTRTGSETHSLPECCERNLAL